jgi:hypothetical protein
MSKTLSDILSLRDYLRSGNHHFFLSGVEAAPQDTEVEAEDVEAEDDVVETVP